MDEIILKLRDIFSDIVLSAEDNEFDAPEELTGYTMDFVNYRCPNDESLLHVAALRNEIEGAKLLVELGVDIDLIGDMGNTALHYSARKGYKKLYEFLISCGADKAIVNEFGKTPRQYLEEK